MSSNKTKQSLLRRARQAASTVPIIALIVLSYEALVRSDASIANRLGDRYGEVIGGAEATALDEQIASQTDFNRQTRLGTKTADSMAGAYDRYTATRVNGINRAINQEYAITNTQMQALSGADWANKLIIGVGDIGCIAGAVMDEAELRDIACAGSQAARRQMVSAYADILPDERAQLLEDELERIPHPSEFVGEEFSDFLALLSEAENSLRTPSDREGGE